MPQTSTSVEDKFIAPNKIKTDNDGKLLLIILEILIILEKILYYIPPTAIYYQRSSKIMQVSLSYAVRNKFIIDRS